MQQKDKATTLEGELQRTVGAQQKEIEEKKAATTLRTIADEAVQSALRLVGLRPQPPTGVPPQAPTGVPPPPQAARMATVIRESENCFMKWSDGVECATSLYLLHVTKT